jgi:hypothetical protein
MSALVRVTCIPILMEKYPLKQRIREIDKIRIKKRNMKKGQVMMGLLLVKNVLYLVLLGDHLTHKQLSTWTINSEKTSSTLDAWFTRFHVVSSMIVEVIQCH